jgi:hypothetical protein
MTKNSHSDGLLKTYHLLEEIMKIFAFFGENSGSLAVLWLLQDDEIRVRIKGIILTSPPLFPVRSTESSARSVRSVAYHAGCQSKQGSGGLWSQSGLGGGERAVLGVSLEDEWACLMNKTTREILKAMEEIGQMVEPTRVVQTLPVFSKFVINFAHESYIVSWQCTHYFSLLTGSATVCFFPVSNKCFSRWLRSPLIQLILHLRQSYHHAQHLCHHWLTIQRDLLPFAAKVSKSRSLKKVFEGFFEGVVDKEEF